MEGARTPKICVALVLGTAILLPAAGALADEGNWGDRDSSGGSVAVQPEPTTLGAVACDQRLPEGQSRAERERC
jgi:hypothetical protein